MTISDLSTGEIIDVNESFVEVSGYSAEEIIGASSKDLEMWSDPSVRAAIVDELKKHGRVISMSAIRRSIADHMVQSIHTSAHVTMVHAIDVTNLVSLR